MYKTFYLLYDCNVQAMSPIYPSFQKYKGNIEELFRSCFSLFAVSRTNRLSDTRIFSFILTFWYYDYLLPIMYSTDGEYQKQPFDTHAIAHYIGYFRSESHMTNKMPFHLPQKTIMWWTSLELVSKLHVSLFYDPWES